MNNANEFNSLEELKRFLHKDHRTKYGFPVEIKNAKITPFCDNGKTKYLLTYDAYEVYVSDIVW